MFLLSRKPITAPFDNDPNFDLITHSEPIEAGKWLLSITWPSKEVTVPLYSTLSTSKTRFSTLRKTFSSND